MRPAERTFIESIERITNPEGRLGYLRLDKNENLKGASKAFLKKFKNNLTAEVVSVYPEIEGIRKSVADYAGVSSGCIFLSHGSDGAIKQVFDVFAREGSSVVLLEPTYAMYEIYAKMAGCAIEWVKCNKDFVVSEKQFMASIGKNTSVVAIANPNSPTGSEFSVDFLLQVLNKCRKIGVLLLIDEAYFPFSKKTIIGHVPKEENLIVTRTFSKAFALGGCRAGFMAVSPNLIESVKKGRPMYEINALSALAIKTCLQDTEEMKKYVRQVSEGRDYLVGQFKKLGLVPYPTNTNFMNILLPGKLDAEMLQKFGRARRILFKGSRGLGYFNNCVRITLGPKKYMARFVKLLRKFIDDSCHNG